MSQSIRTLAMVRICITYVSTPSYTSSKWSTQKLFFWRAETQTIHAPAAKLPKHIALKKAILEIGSVVKLNQNMRKISKLHMFEMICQKHNITMAKFFQCNRTYPDVDRFPAWLLVEVRRETNVSKSGEFFFPRSNSIKFATDGKVWHISGI